MSSTVDAISISPLATLAREVSKKLQYNIEPSWKPSSQNEVTHKVLCVGTDAELDNLRCEVLRHSGYQSYSVNSEKALDTLKREHYSVVLLDASVPSDIAEAMQGENIVFLPRGTAGQELIEIVRRAE